MLLDLIDSARKHPWTVGNRRGLRELSFAAVFAKLIDNFIPHCIKRDKCSDIAFTGRNG